MMIGTLGFQMIIWCLKIIDFRFFEKTIDGDV